MKAISAAVFTAGGRTRRERSSTTPRDWTLSSIHDLCLTSNESDPPSTISVHLLPLLWCHVTHFNRGFVFCTVFLNKKLMYVVLSSAIFFFLLSFSDHLVKLLWPFHDHSMKRVDKVITFIVSVTSQKQYFRLLTFRWKLSCLFKHFILKSQSQIPYCCRVWIM